MSYRYRRKYRRNSTNVIKMKFQSFMDISTDVDSMKIITISAGGKNVVERLRAQFSAYKYYKLGNVSVKLVPASTLPVDPTGLAYGVDQKVDPRDQLSPGLCRITNGEDIFEDITGLSDDVQHKIYNSMMLDQRWFKWMLQRGVKRHGSPRYWTIGQLHQDKWPGAFQNVPYIVNNTSGDPELRGTAIEKEAVHGSSRSTAVSEGSDPRGIFQTGHRGVLGWMPTDDLQPIRYPSSNVDVPLIASPPEIEMFKIILPKAYKTRFYYRVFISETVYFKDPIVTTCFSDNAYAPLDVFHRPAFPSPRTPDASYTLDIADNWTGGNYGDD